MQAATPMWRNGRRNGLKIRQYASLRMGVDAPLTLRFFPVPRSVLLNSLERFRFLNAERFGTILPMTPLLSVTMTRAITFAIGLLLYAVALPVHAATITVTNTNDSGPGSLRQALTIANDGDTIGFAVTGTISLTSGELVIDKNITISGPGPGLLTVVRSQQAADFRIFNIPPSHTAEIDGLTITGGSLVGNGGGISSGATLTISNCAISGNSITADGVEYSGAGIYNVGTMTIVNSTVNNNQALIVGFLPPFGGGISNDGGTLTIQNTTISENTAAGSGSGGGVYNVGSLTAINSTIRGNTGSSGGGISGGGATIINCTISGNRAVFEGGGIYGGGTISNCTISGNMTTVGHGRGGGISGSGTITNSTFSDNVAIDGGNICATSGPVQLGNTILNNGNIFVLGSGTVTSHGYNLSSDNGGGFLNGPGDQINTDPLLGPLQDNGGPTFTHELLPGSPAIDAGDPNFTPPPYYDQRGPVFWRVRNGRIDVGSFEVQAGTTPSPTPTPTASPTPTATPTLTPRPSPTARPALTPRPRPTPPPRP